MSHTLAVLNFPFEVNSDKIAPAKFRFKKLRLDTRKFLVISCNTVKNHSFGQYFSIQNILMSFNNQKTIF